LLEREEAGIHQSEEEEERAQAVFRSTGITLVCSGQETGWKPHDLSETPSPGSQKRKGLGRKSPAKGGIISAAEYSAWPRCKQTLTDT